MKNQCLRSPVKKRCVGNIPLSPPSCTVVHPCASILWCGRFVGILSEPSFSMPVEAVGVLATSVAVTDFPHTRSTTDSSMCLGYQRLG